ncbi:triphosphoribosyl-dephospho-CoA synthase [Halobacteriales archaeon QS_4_69_34]|nr:MAG: triphosphoribosyl-dephospho-CoA synthase [Halobacteriales archaeon QS_4_69_34]
MSGSRAPGRTVAENAQLALLLEVTGTPKPGNVDREHDYPDLRFEHFVTGAVGALEGFRTAAAGEPVGAAFERAIAGMAEQRGGNTQFGAALLLCPLVAAMARAPPGGNGEDVRDGGNDRNDRELTPAGVAAVVEAATVADAADFYRAFEYVDVAVDDPPTGMEALDVRRGEAAIPELEARGLTLAGVMERSADVDGVAREWVGGFERSFRAAERIAALDGPVPERTARAFLEALADEPDTFVRTQHDAATAREATERARAALDGDVDPDELADEFVDRGINPGTTADVIAAGLFIALERGLSV